MIACPGCSKANGLDSRFCRHCGVALPEEELRKGLDKVEIMVSDGRKLFAEDRPAEAKLAAETVLEAHPEHPGALSLLGDVLESEDDLEGAVECFRKVIEINPDASLEQIRLVHLERQLEAMEYEEPAPANRKMAVLVSVAASVLLVTAGVALILGSSRGANAEVQVAQQDYAPSIDTFQGYLETPIYNPYQGDLSMPAPVPEETPAQPSQPPVRNPITSNIARPSLSGAPVSPMLPGIGSGNPFSPLSPNVEISPIPGGTASNFNNPPASGQGGVDPDPQPQAPANREQERPRPAGVIQITPSQTNPRTSGGSEFLGDGSPAPSAPSNNNESENLVRVAQQHFQLGNYEAAADAYNRAIRAGQATGFNYQRLAQSYERLNRNNEARDAYRNAVRAFETAIERNPGQADRYRTALASSRQALQNLGG